MEIIDNPDKTSTSVEKLSADDTFLSTMRKRLDRSVTNESEERDKGQKDIKFINGEQWEKSVLDQRGKGRNGSLRAENLVLIGGEGELESPRIDDAGLVDDLFAVNLLIVRQG